MLSNADSKKIQEISNNDSEIGRLFTALQEEQKFTVSQISHEIRNPVTLINSFLQLLEGKYPVLTQDTYFTKVMENMNFLRTLLDEFSQYNNSFRITKKETNFYHLVASIADSVRPTLTASGISLTLEKNAPLVPLLLDAPKMQEALLNLIRNSAESMPDGGTLALTLNSDSTDITLCITDSGSGIPAEYIATLFAPFVTHKKEGTGLGLPIVKRIIEAHQGSIRVESKIDAGTTFILTLPIYPH